MKFNRTHWILLGCGGVCLAFVIWIRMRPDMLVPQRQIVANSRQEQVEIGGVRRPISDLKSAPFPRPEIDKNHPVLQMNYGVSPEIPADANPQVASVAEAMRTQKHFERLSLIVPPKPFDAQAFAANPTAYLNVVEPGRVWQAAQPGPGIKRIESMSPRRQTTEQGLYVPLKVKVAPRAPVTFTALDLGAFENELVSITVRANDEGIAETKFKGTPGTINNVNILAASPLSSGQLHFIVTVELPRVRAGG